MKIRNFFLIVSLLGMYAKSTQPASIASSATQQVWHSDTNTNQIQASTIRRNMLRLGTKVGVVRWTTYTSADGLASNYVNAVTGDSAGKVWFGTPGGLSQFDGASWTTYTSADGLVDSRITHIASDPAGNVWFGTDYGVSKFDGVTWTNYLAGWTISAIASDPAGNIWGGLVSGGGCYKGCSGFGVRKFDGTTWTTYTKADGLASNYITAIAADKNGNVWFGTDHYGISKFDGTTWTTYTVAGGIVDKRVTAIASDLAGNAWVGIFGSGASRFDGAAWIDYTTANGLASNNVYAIAGDAAGNVWFGTDHGVSKFDGSTWSKYTTADGLVNNDVTAISVDAAGDVWIGTNGSGVSEFYTIHLNGNYDNGAPGSYFNLNGDHFLANQSVPVTVNGSQLGDVPISSNGTFTFTLSTANTGQVIYLVKVGDQPALQLRLSLDAQQPIHPKEGDYAVIDIPSGIALTPHFYLPILQR